MAFAFICKSVLNGKFNAFFEKWNTNFPDLKHAKRVLLDTSRDLVDLNKMLLKRAAEGKGDPTVDEKNQLTSMGKLFMHSFRPHAARLKRCDETLIREPTCTFLRHMEIRTKWMAPAAGAAPAAKTLSDEDKKDVFHWLNYMYLVCEMFVVCPEPVMRKLEVLIGGLFYKVVTLKQKFNKAEFLVGAKGIMADLNQETVTVLTDYFWEFIISPFTPILALTPEKHHKILKPLLKGVQDEKSRSILMGEIAPLVSKVTSRVGHTDLAYNEDGGKLGFTGELAGDSKEARDKQTKEKERILEHIIDAVAEVLDENKDLVNRLMAEPENGLSLLMVKLAPIVFKMIGLGGGASDEEEIKQREEERKHRADAYLGDLPVFTRDIPKA
jgi:hypothetical protein